MFNNIGDKIKMSAKVYAVIGIILSVINGILLIAEDDDLILLGFLVMILGSLFFWVSSFTLYGFGEVIKQLEYSNANSKKLYELLETKETNKPIDISQTTEKVKEPTKSKHKWLCNACGKLRDKSPCPYCGNE